MALSRPRPGFDSRMGKLLFAEILPHTFDSFYFVLFYYLVNIIDHYLNFTYDFS